MVDKQVKQIFLTEIVRLNWNRLIKCIVQFA